MTMANGSESLLRRIEKDLDLTLVAIKKQGGPR
jgi:hypothetical protein